MSENAVRTCSVLESKEGGVVYA